MEEGGKMKRITTEFDKGWDIGWWLGVDVTLIVLLIASFFKQINMSVVIIVTLVGYNLLELLFRGVRGWK